MTPDKYRERAAEIVDAVYSHTAKGCCDPDLMKDVYAGKITALCASVAEESAPRWIPVGERLPSEDGYYLVAFNHAEMMEYGSTPGARLAFFNNHGAFWDMCMEAEDGLVVTHWQPLPPPPKGE